MQEIKQKLHCPYSDLSHRGGDKVGSIFLTTEKAPIAEKLIKEYEELRLSKSIVKNDKFDLFMACFLA